MIKVIEDFAQEYATKRAGDLLDKKNEDVVETLTHDFPRAFGHDYMLDYFSWNKMARIGAAYGIKEWSAEVADSTKPNLFQEVMKLSDEGAELGEAMVVKTVLEPEHKRDPREISDKVKPNQIAGRRRFAFQSGEREELEAIIAKQGGDIVVVDYVLHATPTMAKIIKPTFAARGKQIGALAANRLSFAAWNSGGWGHEGADYGYAAATEAVAHAASKLRDDRREMGLPFADHISDGFVVRHIGPDTYFLMTANPKGFAKTELKVFSEEMRRRFLDLLTTGNFVAKPRLARIQIDPKAQKRAYSGQPIPPSDVRKMTNDAIQFSKLAWLLLQEDDRYPYADTLLSNRPILYENPRFPLYDHKYFVTMIWEFRLMETIDLTGLFLARYLDQPSDQPIPDPVIQNILEILAPVLENAPIPYTPDVHSVSINGRYGKTILDLEAHFPGIIDELFAYFTEPIFGRDRVEQMIQTHFPALETKQYVVLKLQERYGFPW